MRIERLYRYPVKGLTAEALEEAHVEAGGALPWDRAFALAQGDSGFDADHPAWMHKSNFMCLLKNARIATLRAAFDPHDRCLTIRAPDGSYVAECPLTASGRERIGAFLARFLGEEARGEAQFHHVPGHVFGDSRTPAVSLIALSSLRAFERDVGANRDPIRFRANIYFSGSPPWAEFDWVERTLQVGGATLRVVKRTRRCNATQVNPTTAERDADPVRELMHAYGHTDLGIHTEVLEGGRIAVGDTIAVLPSISERLPRAALVTGGALRLGRAITLALAGAGFAVGIHCRRSRDEAETLAAEIRAGGGRACVLAADLQDETASAALVPQAIAALGPLGLLVNNASTFERDQWDGVTRESWDRHIEPNLRAPFVLMQAMAQALPAAAEGLVVNMLDERVWSLTPHFVSYTVAKAGLWALTRQMALALAPRIRVNGIGPGPALPSPRQTKEQFARQCASVPLGRGTGPDEVARAVLAILALPSMTGQMIALDGGQHLQWSPTRSALAE